MAVTGGGRAARLRVESVAAAGRAGAPEKAVALTGGERVAEVTYVAERDRPEAAVGDEALETVDAVPELSGRPLIEIEEISEEPKDTLGPTRELDLFG
jgi:hypothetical protein